eukprot:TRINITY_DN6148_c0_g1_i1.p1 TRINITY_DN6148_c0_g1~~TRINITY_DN6148_c0_g1_i1.p1  ORF type:complete len:774 (+),score=259.54 TRINITY_DN6148_c0_g1_i1:278-2323(+)
METFLLFSWLVGCMLSDMHSAARGDRQWNYAVIIMDLALVLNVETRATLWMLAALVLYLAVISVDTSTSGLYKELSPDTVPWICECGEPPCMRPAASAVQVATSATLIFLIDFFLTRGFATRMREQMSAVQAAVAVTEAMAELLSLYEVEEGRAVLEGEAGRRLPDKLRAALSRLLHNLEEYKPYLPAVMLVREDARHQTAVEPPGLGREAPALAVCFTDVQSSTELWEYSAQGMYDALRTHNDVVRRTVGSAGYEVKVIGDSFMLAFESAEDACRFGLDAQVALVQAKWPSVLLQHPLCAQAVGEGGSVLWSGLRVRIGVHYGPVRVERNPVTGRCDYFGPTVNTASRVEGCLRAGGVTGVTDSVLEELPPGAMARLGNPVVLQLGPRLFKGLAAHVRVSVLLLQRLAGRKALLEAAWLPADPPPDSRLCLRPSTGSARRAADGHSPPREELSRRPATCASFRARVEAEITALAGSVVVMLESVEQAAALTQGVVVATMSVQALVVWNGPLACSDHCGQCLRALDHVRRSRFRGIAAGACSGEVLYGAIAAGRKKYAAVVGGCVELSAALAEGAEEDGEAALAVGSFALYCGTQSRARRHASWAVRGSSARIAVLSLSAPAYDEQEEEEEADRWAGGGDDRDTALEFCAVDGLCSQADRGTGRAVAVGPGVLMPAAERSW